MIKQSIKMALVAAVAVGFMAAPVQAEQDHYIASMKASVASRAQQSDTGQRLSGVVQSGRGAVNDVGSRLGAYGDRVKNNETVASARSGVQNFRSRANEWSSGAQASYDDARGRVGATMDGYRTQAGAAVEGYKTQASGAIKGYGSDLEGKLKNSAAGQKIAGLVGGSAAASGIADALKGGGVKGLKNVDLKKVMKGQMGKMPAVAGAMAKFAAAKKFYNQVKDVRGALANGKKAMKNAARNMAKQKIAQLKSAAKAKMKSMLKGAVKGMASKFGG